MGRVLGQALQTVLVCLCVCLALGVMKAPQFQEGPSSAEVASIPSKIKETHTCI